MTSKGSPQRQRWRALDSVWRWGRRNAERGSLDGANISLGVQVQRQGRRANRHGWSWEEIKRRVNEGFLGHRSRI